MTVVAGLISPTGSVYIGADSAATDGAAVTVRADPKCFKRGPFVLGFCGSFRVGDLLRHKADMRSLVRKEMGGRELMVKAIVPYLQHLLKANKASKDWGAGTDVMIGYRGRLFTIACDWQVSESALGYEAIGCGAPYALGSLYSTPKLDTRKRLLVALEAAVEHSEGVRPPFTVERLSPAR